MVDGTTPAFTAPVPVIGERLSRTVTSLDSVTLCRVTAARRETLARLMPLTGFAHRCLFTDRCLFIGAALGVTSAPNGSPSNGHGRASIEKASCAAGWAEQWITST